MVFDSKVWGPHYWFFLHSVARTYPLTPNSITKRKYYDLIQNMPLFIPDEKMGNKFGELLDKYPVTPYLDSRDSFMRWIHFIHNRINTILGKEEISFLTANDKYNAEYKPKTIYISEKINLKKHYIHALIIIVCLLIVYMFYN